MNGLTTPDGSIRRFTHEREDEDFEAWLGKVKGWASLLFWLLVVPGSYVALLLAWAK